jgi:hypothetical protein
MRYCCFLRPAAFTGAIFVLTFLSACKKTTPAPDANTSLLASHSWRLFAFADTDNTYTPPRTIYPTFSAYRLDDAYQFNTDNGLIFNDGTRVAAPGDAPISTGNWQFQNGQAGLSITLRRAVTLGTTGITSTTVYDIVKLSADTLRLRTGTLAQTVVVTLVK